MNYHRYSNLLLSLVMTWMFYSGGVVFLTLLFTGCATYPEHSITNQDITFQRNAGFAGLDCKTAISINGHPKGIVRMNDILQFSMTPGHHLLEAKASSGACPNFADNRIIDIDQKTVEVLQIKVIQE